MSSIKISLAVPTYGRPAELEELLESIPEHISVYVCDNGDQLTSEYKSRYPGIRFKGCSDVVPMFANWNRALEYSEGDWVAIPSDDDIYLPDAFETVAETIKNNPNAGVLVFGHHIIDGDGVVKSSWAPANEYCVAPEGFKNFQYGVDARMISVFFNKKILQELRGFDRGFTFTAADSDFVQRAAMIGDVVFIDHVIAKYRVWEGGTTVQKIATQEWMQQVEYWLSNVESFGDRRGLSIFTSHMRDEIYARNLLSGIMIARENAGFQRALEHFRACRFPWKALLATQARIFYRLFRP